MKILASYYKLDRNGSRLGRARCQEHIPVTDPIKGTTRPLCGVELDTEQYAWKVINSQPQALCRVCERKSSTTHDDRERLRAWETGEPIR